ncbi:hypothetical protein CERSUDRAFT_83847 [Gelatoporia subvermispora B]|uniref:Arrestin-like N-terminal domain-containing protein n=1 Tax=Ceriporiopsis subvermispora (strain B) TaxID=914234 RepID=M2RED9_CERS8|nr:hypothetical protein CERSUDRAFT_83847 [Gelatoporia subvermispora B]
MNEASPPYSTAAGSSSLDQTSNHGHGSSERGNTSFRPSTEHSYYLTSRKGPAWLTLKVTSHARSSGQLPSFFQGDAVAGVVELNLVDEESIKAVSIAITGQLTTSATDVFTFLQLSEELWSPSMGLPTPTAGTTSSVKSNGRLRGSFSWQFSLALPTVVDMKWRSGSSEPCSLPPSFSERMARVHIQYQLLASVRRGLFHVDAKVGTVFAYTPIIRPEAPSLLRQISYLESAPLPGPEEDPEGWTTLKSIKIRGTIFHAREIDVTCTLSLAQPLCYTRGSVIPCLMDLQTDDLQALHILADSRAPVVRLLRQVSMGVSTASSMSGKVSAGVAFQPAIQDTRQAVWWPSSRNSRSNVRRLEGEILLNPALKPSCRMGEFELSYSVGVYPLKAVAFTAQDASDHLLQSVPVTIATAYPPGPRARIHSPPDYDDFSSIGQASEFFIP